MPLADGWWLLGRKPAVRSAPDGCRAAWERSDAGLFVLQVKICSLSAQAPPDDFCREARSQFAAFRSKRAAASRGMVQDDFSKHSGWYGDLPRSRRRPRRCVLCAFGPRRDPSRPDHLVLAFLVEVAGGFPTAWRHPQAMDKHYCGPPIGHSTLLYNVTANRAR